MNFITTYRTFLVNLFLLVGLGVGAQSILFNDPTEYSLNTIDSKIFELPGEPGILTFEAKKSSWGLGSLYIDIWDGSSWERVASLSLGSDYSSFGPIALPYYATRLKFCTEFGSTLYKYFKDVTVTKARYIAGEDVGLFTIDNYEKQLTVRYADIQQPITITSSSPYFYVLDPVGAIGSANSNGTALITVQFLPDSIGVYNGNLLLTDGRTTTHIPLSGRWSLASNEQQIVWTQSLAYLSPGDTVLLNAYSTSGLPISYSSDEGTVISLRADTLVAHQLGSAQVLAEQLGDDSYLAAPSVRAYVMVTEPLTYLDDAIQEDVYIYPNPVEEGFYLYGITVDNALLTDAIGRAVAILTSDKSTPPYFAMPSLPAGVYKLHLRNSNSYTILVVVVK